VSDAETLLRQAQAHKLAGRPGEAAEAYEALLAIQPDLPDTWFNLALMQRQAGRPAAALTSYQEALDRRVSGPEEVHLNRAVIYSDDLGQADAAEAELKTALAIAPTYLAAWLNLGNLCEDKGEREQARAAYRRALDLAPPASAPLALARLANATRFTDAADPLIADLRASLARPGALDADRAEVGYALGRALDEVQAYGEAFESYGAANAASR
jgi:tetratricopeptide (TPR) repeat protein